MSFRTTISYLLFPLTMWYAVGVAVRNVLYAVGLKKQVAPHITTIGVGNLSTGGSGKTPHVEYLLQLLADKYPTAVLSRGYKRKSHGFVLDDGSHDPAQLGDEPAMMAAKFPQVQFAVCENRIEGVKRLINAGCEAPDTEDAAAETETTATTPNSELSQSPTSELRTPNSELKNTPELIILDDVFQHRHITPNINILLTEYRHPYYKDRILPYGNLREFRSGRSRAGIVIVTKCPDRLKPIERHNIVHDLSLQNYQKVFFSYLKYGTPRTFDGAPADLDLRHLDGVLVVTGIAHPEPLLDELRRTCKVHHLAFPDHHNFSKGDIARIHSAFDAIQGSRKLIITTEKDSVRLRGLTGDMPVYFTPIEVAFHEETDADFDHTIESTVRENISFLNKLSIWS
ncbi:MAG: tetraacyldisaccharide 4'-kinase [Bacteroidales bacterium]|nr:tetraacyldisaccharide 4'-kinase [Bacteroidales bacterium]